MSTAATSIGETAGPQAPHLADGEWAITAAGSGPVSAGSGVGAGSHQDRSVSGGHVPTVGQARPAAARTRP